MKKSIVLLPLVAACSVFAHAQSNLTNDITFSAASPIVTNPINNSAKATSAEIRARNYQTWLKQINQPYANQLGSFNGKGITIGIVDSGAQITHAELKNQVVQSYNAFTGSKDVTDKLGHGTYTSGILAGSLANGGLLQGVASGAKIAMAKVFDQGKNTSNTQVDAGINWLVNTIKTPIINLSLGSNAPTSVTAMKNAVNKGALLTVASGNDGAKTGVSWPARYAKESWAKNQIIVVGAVDAKNKMATFSNYGADTAKWFVVAPGVSVASSYVNNQYAYSSGTSAAAPMVAGQAALIKSEWNWLTASQLSQIIFKSATRLGKGTDTTPDPVYGWGLINVAKSMTPDGPVQATVTKGVTTLSLNIGKTKYISGAGTIGTKSLNVVGTDNFGRGFSYNLAQSVTSPQSQKRTSDEMVRAIEKQEALTEQINNGSHLLFSLSKSSTDHVLPTTFAFSSAPNNGHTFGFGMGGSNGRYFGLQASGYAPVSFMNESSFNVPYLNMVKGASHVGYSAHLSGHTLMRMGILAESKLLSEQETSPFSKEELGGRKLINAEMEHRFDRGVGILSFGLLQENGSLLGSYSNEALALSVQPKTVFAALSGGYMISSNTSLAALFSYGKTGGFTNQSSLVSSVSAVSTVAYSLGISTKNIVNTGDHFGVTLSMPTKVISGEMYLTGPVSQNSDDGTLNYATQTLNLRPTATEHDLEFSYSTPMAQSGKITAGLMLRQNPGHDATAASDKVAVIRYTKAF